MKGWFASKNSFLIGLSSISMALLASFGGAEKYAFCIFFITIGLAVAALTVSYLAVRVIK
ncbi:hypothetical protein C4564_05955 [Candidatus Microgenomates bacterium]|nr:MAG: hypothetical protein C4564_05955 [Candidatus Microgenomates bacterium]